jgi:hypothetical protein
MKLRDKIRLAQSEEARNFYEAHAGDDPLKLMLKYAKSPEKKWLASQLGMRKKLKRKLPQWVNNPHIIFPDGVPKEQASSEQTAKLKASLLNGKTMLDITGGMGVDSYYMGQSFEQSFVYEQQEELAQITMHNLQILGANNLIKNEAFLPEKITSSIDLIYADPARRDAVNAKLIGLSSYTPDMTKWLPQLLQKAKAVLIKTSPMLGISEAIKELKVVNEIWVISVRNECKEVLYHCTSDNHQTLRFRLFNLRKEGLDANEYIKQELDAKPTLANSVEKYIYEPNASLMKAGAGDALAVKMHLKKLHNNTNLYTSKELYTEYPGKVFEIEKLLKPYDKTLQKQRFNVISRNYFHNASEIANKLKLKPASTDYLLAFTFYKGKTNESQGFAKAHLLRI